MKNEPVAWMLDYEISGIQGGEYRTNPFRHKNPRWDGNYEIREVTNAIPLYTHPAELTDEEVLQQAEWIFGTHFFECIDDPYWIEFARAILRKAQEK